MRLQARAINSILSSVIALLVTFLLCSNSTALSQGESQLSSRLLFSSSHSRASCELGAALDSISVELMTHPGARGYIIIYTNFDDPPGLFHRHALGVKSHLVNTRNIEPDRIVIVDGGVYEKFLAEYWLVPEGARPPSSGVVWTPEIQMLKLGKFDEFVWVSSCEDLYEYRRASTQLNGFAQALLKNPDAAGYLIGYAEGKDIVETYSVTKNGKEEYETRKLRMTGNIVAKRVKDNLVKLFGATPSRIVTIDGGYRKFQTIELWLAAPGEEAPRPTPEKRK